jgi:hypothetical protein
MFEAETFLTLSTDLIFASLPPFLPDFLYLGKKIAELGSML